MKLSEMLHKTEGKIFFVGVSLTILSFLGIFFIYLNSVEFGSQIVGIIGTHLLFGRAAGLAFGYAVHLGQLDIIVVNILIEVILVLLIYPLFVFSYENLFEIKFLNAFFRKVETFKNNHYDKFDQYGIYGLFLFVWLPFWMTGPVVGAIIGFLIGLRHRTIIVVVTLGTSFAIIIWALFLNELSSFLLTFGSSAIWVLLLIIVAVTLLLKLKRKD
ncbi:MAG: small multi-drug export protein [Candidatus Marinarcus sp.]|uniref:small multi-drug export protein n=1 Tax=Candidatus Marinarcus sp. TaxID=3100987 RepID=UPI003AFFD32E